MDLFQTLSLLWLPGLAIAAVMHLRAIYLKRLLVRKYKFVFPKSFLRTSNIAELLGNYESTDSSALKHLLARLVSAKKWSYIAVAIAVLAYAAPVLLKLWLSQSSRG
jgi:hypothetical protein